MMGGRLSRPKGPAGTTEAGRSLTPTAVSSSANPSANTSSIPSSLLTRLRAMSRARGRATPLIPLVTAALLGGTLYVYSRTTIAAAKENARRAREADGGSISWRKEGLRRHGRIEGVKERGIWEELRGKGGKVEGRVDGGGGRKMGKGRVGEDYNVLEEEIARRRDEGGKDGGGDG